MAAQMDGVDLQEGNEGSLDGREDAWVLIWMGPHVI